jgi:hypothetical protein
MHFDRLFLILRNMDYTDWDLVVRLPQQIGLCHFSTFLSWDTQLQLSICLLFFLYCYFTLDIVVLTLKIDHCLVFISIKFSYLILSYLILRVYESGLFNYCNSKRSLHLAKFLFKNITQIETWWCDYRSRLDYAMSDRLQNTDTFKKIHWKTG